MSGMNDNIPTLQRKYTPLSVILSVLLIMAGGILVWQWTKISSLNKEISSSKTTLLPQKKYASYEDCISNGGIVLNTINIQFSGCLGSNEADAGGVPQYQAFMQFSAQNLPRIEEHKTAKTENKVTTNGSYSPDLVAFLKSDDSGCATRGEYEIVKEVPGRFALMKYGCDRDEQVQSASAPTIIAMKLSDGWRLLSPTNNMQGTTPSCLLVDVFKISKELSQKCFENTGYNNGALRDVLYQ